MELHVTRHVALPTEQLPCGLPVKPEPDDQTIVHFHNDYRHWILDYAALLVNGKGVREFDHPHFINDAGFAFLALVNGYFDIIGQLSGGDNDGNDCYRSHKDGNFEPPVVDKVKNWTLWDASGIEENKPLVNRRVWYGLTAVFNEGLVAANLDPRTNVDWAEFCHLFYKSVRNPVAHTMFPHNTFISRDEKVVAGIIFLENNKIPALNIPMWYETISQHFVRYTERIRCPMNSEDEDLRQRFLSRYPRLNGD